MKVYYKAPIQRGYTIKLGLLCLFFFLTTLQAQHGGEKDTVAQAYALHVTSGSGQCDEPNLMYGSDAKQTDYDLTQTILALSSCLYFQFTQ